MATGHNGGYKCLCPACGERMRVMKGEAESLAVSRMYAQCSNLLCSMTVSGTLSFDFALEPTQLAAPLMRLPIAPSKLKKPAPSERAPALSRGEHIQQLQDKGLSRLEISRAMNCSPESVDRHSKPRQESQSDIFA